ncbi:pilus assembly protein TadG-related protein [Streptomyces albidoflavus]|uniref:pilus assembly protein TadG-related protein n=1 Tax=Streptomyces albidoflavus TaxID=1886 RepID=UPI0033DC7544
MRLPVGGDRGQALPLFVWVAGAVLFAAFAFFAFAQAAVARNGAQSAADAAALAAAQDERAELIEGLVEAIIEQDDSWLDWLNAEGSVGAGAEDAAVRLASENDSQVTGFNRVAIDGNPASRVEVRTRFSVGETVIPGTESQHARAKAIAVIVPRCEVDDESADIVEFSCEGSGDYSFDAGSFSENELPDASALFMVHLVG